MATGGWVAGRVVSVMPEHRKGGQTAGGWRSQLNCQPPLPSVCPRFQHVSDLSAGLVWEATGPQWGFPFFRDETG